MTKKSLEYDTYIPLQNQQLVFHGTLKQKSRIQETLNLSTDAPIYINNKNKIRATGVETCDDLSIRCAPDREQILALETEASLVKP